MLPLNEEAITKNYISYQIHFEVILNLNCYFFCHSVREKNVPLFS